MKLIKAYVRVYKAGKVVDILEKLKIHRLMAVHAERIGHGVFKEYEHFDSEMGTDYVEMIKIELVCPDDQAQTITEAIIENARTEYQGDGLVIVSPVEEATSIRTGKSVLIDS